MVAGEELEHMLLREHKRRRGRLPNRLHAVSHGLELRLGRAPGPARVMNVEVRQLGDTGPRGLIRGPAQAKDHHQRLELRRRGRNRPEQRVGIHQLRHDAPHAPHIQGLGVVVPGPKQHLRRTVRQGGAVPRVLAPAARNDPSHAQIGDLEHRRPRFERDQYVARLQIAVRHAVRMHVGHALHTKGINRPLKPHTNNNNNTSKICRANPCCSAASSRRFRAR